MGDLLCLKYRMRERKREKKRERERENERNYQNIPRGGKNRDMQG